MSGLTARGRNPPLGPYNKETPPIEKLVKFIWDSGYTIADSHKEEYLKGPGIADSTVDYWLINATRPKRNNVRFERQAFVW